MTVSYPILRKFSLAAAPAATLLLVLAAISRVSSPALHTVSAETLPPPLVIAPQASKVPVHVLTQRNNNGRTGNQLAETQLNVQTVSATRFGKLFSRTVDGDIYAQPLYVSGLKVRGETRPRNVVFVATQHNSVYGAREPPLAGEPGPERAHVRDRQPVGTSLRRYSG
jgi:hypothetical protein